MDRPLDHRTYSLSRSRDCEASSLWDTGAGWTRLGLCSWMGRRPGQWASLGAALQYEWQNERQILRCTPAPQRGIIQPSQTGISDLQVVSSQACSKCPPPFFFWICSIVRNVWKRLTSPLPSNNLRIFTLESVPELYLSLPSPAQLMGQWCWLLLQAPLWAGSWLGLASEKPWRRTEGKKKGEAGIFLSFSLCLGLIKSLAEAASSMAPAPHGWAHCGFQHLLGDRSSQLSNSVAFLYPSTWRVAVVSAAFISRVLYHSLLSSQPLFSRGIPIRVIKSPVCEY